MMTKWKYKAAFVNSCCAIKVYTTSRPVYDLIRNHLDFSGARGPKPGLEISFYIDEVNDKNPYDNKNFVYNSYFDDDKTLSLALGSGIARVTADARKGTVRGEVISYRECCKETILYLTFFRPLYLFWGITACFFCMHRW